MFDLNKIEAGRDWVRLALVTEFEGLSLSG